jgi:DNA-binding transcriptional MerR regulator
VTAGVFTIGSAARILQVPVATIRTWEKRYGGIVPARSSGGQRLYTREEIERLRFVASRIAEGMRPGEAHRLLHADDGLAALLELELPADTTAPGVARRAIDGFAAGLPDEPRFNLRLLVSELVANSVRHGAGVNVRLHAKIDGERVRVEISDDGVGFTWSKGESCSEGGRGLPLVAALAERWGLTFDRGTTAWFELRTA